MTLALCSVCGAAAHYRDPGNPEVSLCASCADNVDEFAAQVAGSPPSTLEVIPEDDDPGGAFKRALLAPLLCTRCGLPSEVHGHGELEGRFGKEADPSHRFEEPPSSTGELQEALDRMAARHVTATETRVASENLRAKLEGGSR